MVQALETLIGPGKASRCFGRCACLAVLTVDKRLELTDRNMLLTATLIIAVYVFHVASVCPGIHRCCKVALPAGQVQHVAMQHQLELAVLPYSAVHHALHCALEIASQNIR